MNNVSRYQCTICNHSFTAESGQVIMCPVCPLEFLLYLTDAKRTYANPPARFISDHFTASESQPIELFVKNDRQMDKLVATKLAYEAGFYKS